MPLSGRGYPFYITVTIYRQRQRVSGRSELPNGYSILPDSSYVGRHENTLCWMIGLQLISVMALAQSGTYDVRKERWWMSQQQVAKN